MLPRWRDNGAGGFWWGQVAKRKDLGNLDREAHASAHLVSLINKLFKGWQDGPAGKALAMEA